ncbi:hypothetical protein OKA04_06865 [Luteolibacter flavescens]|uniref:Tetratricopeptide repeat protein n=1 Tax=Luteolibacter flavescens TaxID=1859460 RepID=A0ABT3FLK3_9BACT|nr:hypothetical protein [Luteolibacter flavescens]MCW1884446.1 hypothetical protein [Luteolibacter flavescens]
MDHPPRFAFLQPALRVGLPLILLAAMILAIFQQVFKSPMAFDDNLSIIHVRSFKGWMEIWGRDAFDFFRPMKSLFFLLIEESGGGMTRYHWATLAAYYLATCGVFALTLRLSGNAIVAFATGAIWAIAPTGGTVATWASCFNINLAAAAMTFCALSYDVMRSGSGRRTIIPGIMATLFLVLGLLSYETAIATAPLLVLVDAFRDRKIFCKRSMIHYGVIALIVISWLVCRKMIGAPPYRGNNPSLDPAMPLWQLSASAPYFLWTHLLMWLFPSGRLETFGSYLWDRSVPAVILPFCWIFLLGTIFLGVRLWRRAPLFFFGAAWFIVAAFPSGNFIPMRNTPFADYYVPIPSIGLCLMLAAILRAAIQRLRHPGIGRPAMAGAVAILVGISGWRLAQLPVLFDWLEAWEVPPQIMAKTAAARPHQFFAHASVAYELALGPTEKTPETLDLIEANALEAEKDMPDMAIIYTTLGEVARYRGQRDLAIQHYEKALKLRHISYKILLLTRRQLVLCLMEPPNADYEKAHANLLILLRHHEHVEHPGYVLLAATLMREWGKPEEEIKTLEKGLSYHPDNAEIRTALEKARARAAAPSK